MILIQVVIVVSTVVSVVVIVVVLAFLFFVEMVLVRVDSRSGGGVLVANADAYHKPTVLPATDGAVSVP